MIYLEISIEIFSKNILYNHIDYFIQNFSRV